MPRKLSFRPSMQDTLRANKAAHEFYAAVSGRPTPDAQLALSAGVKAKVSRGPRKPKSTKSEAQVQAEGIHYLCRHPKVQLVIRMNSGAAGYIEFNHLYLPVKFRAVTTAGDPKVLIPDCIVLLTDGRLMAVEFKEEIWVRSFGASVKAVREAGQARFLAYVQSVGGIGIFAQSVSDVEAVL